MKSRNLAVYLVAVTALAGCATAAQRQAANIGTVQQQAVGDFKTCAAAVYNDPSYAAIQSHVLSPDNGFQPTMSQLADDTYPTKHEAQLLIEFHDAGLPCKQAMLEKIERVNPGVGQVMAEEMVAVDHITMQLVKRKITWGESKRQGQQVVLAAKQKGLDASRQLSKDLAASHQAEMAQRQAASNALMQWSVQQQMINTANRPVITNCTEGIGSINCVSNK